MSISKAAQELGRKGGQAKSPAKTAAARANAKKPRTRRNKMDDLHKAVDEVAACITTSRSVTAQALRDIERTLQSGETKLADKADPEYAAFYVAGMYGGLLKEMAKDLAMLQQEADKAQAAVKYLGAKE